MADAVRYVPGGEGEPERHPDAGDNPTGRPRRSSTRTRRKKDRRLFRGTPWDNETKENRS